MKILAVMLMISMLLCICGCKAAPTEATPALASPTEPTPTETTPTEPTPTEPTTGSSADSNSFVSQLLTDINYNGKIQSTANETPVPPGTLPEVSRIPCADQQAVGTTVTINLGAGQTQGSYLYRVDSQTNRELLAVVIHVASEDRNNGFYIPLLAVFEVDLGGLNGLCSVISKQENFSATILSLTNLSFEEGMYTLTSVYGAGIAGADAIDITVCTEAAPNGWYAGHYGGDGSKVCYGGNRDTVSQEINDIFAVFERIFARFSIDF